MTNQPPFNLYLELMRTIRGRFDLVRDLRGRPEHPFLRAEAAAFHGRKIVEGLAFGCLVATDNSFKVVPRDAKGQWNAEDILVSLDKKGITVFPSPSIRRPPTDEERRAYSVSGVYEGIPARRLSRADVIRIYRDLHWWLHEPNPYVNESREEEHANRSPQLWDDLARIELFLESHTMLIRGAGFFTELRGQDGQTRVEAMTKVDEVSADKSAG